MGRKPGAKPRAHGQEPNARWCRSRRAGESPRSCRGQGSVTQIGRSWGERVRSYPGRSSVVPERATVLSRSAKSAEAAVVTAKGRRAAGFVLWPTPEATVARDGGAAIGSRERQSHRSHATTHALQQMHSARQCGAGGASVNAGQERRRCWRPSRTVAGNRVHAGAHRAMPRRRAVVRQPPRQRIGVDVVDGLEPGGRQPGENVAVTRNPQRMRL